MKSADPTYSACHQVGVKVHIPWKTTCITPSSPSYNCHNPHQVLSSLKLWSNNVTPASYFISIFTFSATCCRWPPSSLIWITLHLAPCFLLLHWMSTHILSIPLQAFVCAMCIDQRSSKASIGSRASCFWTVLKAYLSMTSRSLPVVWFKIWVEQILFFLLGLIS